MNIWVAALLHVGVPAGLLTLVAVRLISRSPLWAAALVAVMAGAIWTVLVGLVGLLLPAEVVEPFVWFATE
jgi:hypothetical protein